MENTDEEIRLNLSTTISTLLRLCSYNHKASAIETQYFLHRWALLEISAVKLRIYRSYIVMQFGAKTFV